MPHYSRCCGKPKKQDEKPGYKESVNYNNVSLRYNNILNNYMQECAQEQLTEPDQEKEHYVIDLISSNDKSEEDYYMEYHQEHHYNSWTERHSEQEYNSLDNLVILKCSLHQFSLVLTIQTIGTISASS